MNILYVCQRIPYPPNRGDKIASYHAVRYLARNHSVWVAALADSKAEIRHAEAIQDLGVETDTAVRRPLAARLANTSLRAGCAIA